MASAELQHSKAEECVFSLLKFFLKRWGKNFIEWTDGKEFSFIEYLNKFLALSGGPHAPTSVYIHSYELRHHPTNVRQNLESVRCHYWGDGNSVANFEL